MEDMVNEVVTDVVDEATEQVAENVCKDSGVVNNLVKMGIGGLIAAGVVALAVKVAIPAGKRGVIWVESKLAKHKAKKAAKRGDCFDVPEIPEIEETKK